MVDGKQDNREQYVLRDKRIEVPGVTTLFFSNADGSVPAFVPGQYITVYFPELHTPEGKAYSISSAPGGQTFSITVRAIGEFSRRLCDLQLGDRVSASLPYGFFHPDRDDSEVVMVAAGIGITPFMSILEHAAQATPNRRITLFHGIRSMGDAIFHTELLSLKKRLPHLSIHYFISRESVPAGASIDATVTAGRMSADLIIDHIGGRGMPQQDAEYLLCGSISFVRDLWRDLREHGVPEDAMYTEAFFSH